MLSNLLTRAATSKYRPVRELYDRFSHTTTFQNIINKQSNVNTNIGSNPFLDKPLKTSNIVGKIEDMEMKDVTQNIQDTTPDVPVTQTDVIAAPVDNHDSPENDSTKQKSVDNQPKADDNIKLSTALRSSPTNTYPAPTPETVTPDMNFITAWFWVIIIVLLIVAAVGFLALILYMILYIICYPLLWMMGLT